MSVIISLARSDPFSREYSHHEDGLEYMYTDLVLRMWFRVFVTISGEVNDSPIAQSLEKYLWLIRYKYCNVQIKIVMIRIRG